MAAYYDSVAKETILLMDQQRLTIPDYMKISNIEEFILDKQQQSLIRMMQEVSYKTEQESPLDKAKKHYKDLGWFHDDSNVHRED
jgi:hypothetical protein